MITTEVAAVVADEEKAYREVFKPRESFHWRDKARDQPITVRCASCPDFVFHGDQAECFDAQRQHIAEAHGIKRQPRRDTAQRDEKRAAKEEAFEQFGPVILDLLADGPVKKGDLHAALDEQGLKRAWRFELTNTLEARRVIETYHPTGRSNRAQYWRLVEDDA